MNVCDFESAFREARAQLERVGLRNPAIPPTVSASIDDSTSDPVLVLHVTVEVPDRDTGEPRAFRHRLAVPSGDFLTFVRRAVRAVWVHELDEAWHVDGVRAREPHFPCPGEPWRILPIYENEEPTHG